MLLRYVTMNFRIFATFTPFALVIMLPINWGVGRRHTVDPEEEDVWTVHEALTITHIEPASSRTYAPVVMMFVLTYLVFSRVRREWPAFVAMRHRWLEQQRISSSAA